MQERSFLQEEIEERLALDPRVNNPIKVEVNERHVRLSGVVDTLEEREAAEEISRSFGPVQLDSDIAIEANQVIEDPDVLAAARQALAENPDLAHDVGVERVVNGVAYLRGQSESVAEISKAADIVAHAAGVKDVVSEVRIKTSVPITDVDLHNEVVQGLHHEMPLQAEFIDVKVKDGTVVLDGNVSTMEQKARAGAIAKSMPGAVKVINDITAGTATNDIDQAIENEVLKALEISHINMRDARVSVLDGVVHLDGTVDTIKQRGRAREIAEAVPGVRTVQNDLAIGFHIEPKAG
ncbi:MAG TPA: BON domain-containing protein [Candidatus Aquicultor sp.]|jgi:hyperosmotically inducible protein